MLFKLMSLFNLIGSSVTAVFDIVTNGAGEGWPNSP